ncbi:IPT/TIG domain-containing protein [Chloroflexota bacterium]
MKHNKNFRVLAFTVIFSLLVTAVPATPVHAATLILSPESGPPGTVVTVTGTGLWPNHAIQITFQDTDIQSTSTTNSGTIPTGTFFFVPSDLDDGTYTVDLVSYGNISNPYTIGMSVPVSAVFTVTSGTGSAGSTEVSINPGSGTIGTRIEISGNDFSANEDIIVEFDGYELEIEGSGDTDSSGDFSECYVVIPESTGGDHEIKVTGGNSEVEAIEIFSVEPEIEINPARDSPSSNVEVKGSGFGPGAGIDIYFGSSPDPMLVNFKATSKGRFMLFIPVPDEYSGEYDIRAEDEDGNEASAKFSIEIEARTDISKAEGNVGDSIILSGTAFETAADIIIKYDGEEQTRTMTDVYGAFSTDLSIPSSRGGTHTITVTDGTDTRNIAFRVESKAPPIPKLLEPAMAATTDKKASFDWQDVEDDSKPVSYTFQIAYDTAFSKGSKKLDKKNLDTSGYVLTDVEWDSLLPVKGSGVTKTSYFWRVNAMDGAYNESNWSGVMTFGVIPPSGEPGPETKIAEKEKSGTGFTAWAIWVICLLIASLLSVLVIKSSWLQT